MKTTAIDSSVLGGQGSIGSKELGVPNPAPGVGPVAGVDANLPMQIDNSAAAVGAQMPAVYPLSGPSNEPPSQYDTIKPIPSGNS